MARPRELSRCVCVCVFSCTGVCLLLQSALLGVSTGSPLDPVPPEALWTLLSFFHVMTHTRTPARAARQAASCSDKHTHAHTHKAVSSHSYLRSSSLSLLKNLLKAAAGGFVCASAHICACVCVCVCVCEQVWACISRVAGGRWSKTGDEWREQESGGAWLGQAMGDNMASHLLEANTHKHNVQTHTHTPCLHETKCNPPHWTQRRTHSVTNTYANTHIQPNTCSQRLNQHTHTNTHTHWPSNYHSPFI